jgi:uncharacterized membrane protein YgdD (TMEM256/DUF423 family)
MPWVSVGAAMGFLVVLLGAFGAHGLRTRLTPDMLAVYETAVRYQAYHALALLGFGLWTQQNTTQSTTHAAPSQAVGWLFCVGIVLFSGSLYALALTGRKGLGAITPLGGLAFLAGWALWAWNAARVSG